MTVQTNFWQGFQQLMAQLQPEAQQRPGTAPINGATNIFSQAPANNFGSLLGNIRPPGQREVQDYGSMNTWGMQKAPNQLPAGSYAAQIQNFTARP